MSSNYRFKCCASFQLKIDYKFKCACVHRTSSAMQLMSLIFQFMVITLSSYVLISSRQCVCVRGWGIGSADVRVCVVCLPLCTLCFTMSLLSFNQTVLDKGVHHRGHETDFVLVKNIIYLTLLSRRRHRG